jgi:hypothetical protein
MTMLSRDGTRLRFTPRGTTPPVDTPAMGSRPLGAGASEPWRLVEA